VTAAGRTGGEGMRFQVRRTTSWHFASMAAARACSSSDRIAVLCRRRAEPRFHALLIARSDWTVLADKNCLG
jgi:hypothetical protein